MVHIIYFCIMLDWNNIIAKRLIRNTLSVVTIAGFVYSCASVGRPEGGPIDETPPVLINSTPRIGSVNVNRSRITLEFDEYIQLERPNENVVISPPQIQQPEIRPSGRRVIINLLDSLRPNTTYTIDFGSAIVDNNEGNPLENFSYTFSTGEVIDSMVVSGVLLEAANLEPVKGMLVGLHSNLADSAFTQLPLERVGRTDSRGHFSIRGVAPGTYRIYGLQDADQNYAFTQKSEAIAFNDSLIIPRYEERIRQDTLWVDSLTIDTVIERKYTHYLPDNVTLRSFKEEINNRYLIRGERLTPEKFTLYFSAKADTTPILQGLNFDERNALIVEPSRRNDTINYWVRDSLIYQMDTLAIRLDYLYTDTLNQLVPRTDTLRLAMRRTGGQRAAPERRRRNRDREEEAPEPTVFLNMRANVSSTMDVYGYISLEFDEPIASYDTSAIHLRHKIDTLWFDIPYVFEQDSMNIRKFNIYAEWEPQNEYEFAMDSLAFYGIYGLHTDKYQQAFKVKALQDYGEIFFNIIGADSIAFVELLDGQDNVVRKVPVVNNQADFYYLNPGKYGARLVNDRNGNGVWDTGNFEENRQPEEVFYYWQLLELKVLQTFEQDWNIHSRPLEQQKPEELKKQKPDEDRRNRNRQNAQNRNNTANRRR